jgi:HEAT repeat protein
MRFSTRSSSLRLAASLTAARVQRVVEVLRALPWPVPAQRVARRGVQALVDRFPAIAELLELVPREKPQTKAPTPEIAKLASEVPALLVQLRARGWEERVAAVQALSGRSEPEVCAGLIVALHDRSVEVAVSAATALGVFGGDQAREALAVVLRNADGYYAALTRAAAVSALGRTLASGEHDLLRVALTDGEVEVSIAAIAALIERSDPDTTFALTRILENPQHFFLPVTRLAAARGLSRLKKLDTATIHRLLEREADPAVQQALQRMLVA